MYERKLSVTRRGKTKIRYPSFEFATRNRRVINPRFYNLLANLKWRRYVLYATETLLLDNVFCSVEEFLSKNNFVFIWRRRILYIFVSYSILFYVKLTILNKLFYSILYMITINNYENVKWILKENWQKWMNFLCMTLKSNETGKIVVYIVAKL